MPQTAKGVCSKLARHFGAPPSNARRTLEEKTASSKALQLNCAEDLTEVYCVLTTLGVKLLKHQDNSFMLMRVWTVSIKQQDWKSIPADSQYQDPIRPLIDI